MNDMTHLSMFSGIGGLESHWTEAFVRAPQREAKPYFLGVFHEV